MLRKKRILQILISGVLLIVMIISGCQIWKIQSYYRAENELHENLLNYEPQAIINENTPNIDATITDVKNKEIVALKEKNSDVLGWAKIDDTDISYPFVHGMDNDFYLRRDLHKEYAYAGTIFVDYRCRGDFSDFNTILYGHNMKNGSMFHNLSLFSDKDYFNTHQTGTIYLEDVNLKLEIFAYLLVDSVDLVNFQKEEDPTNLQADYIEFIHINAQQFRDVDISEETRLVTFSTCSYEFDEARAIVVAKVCD